MREAHAESAGGFQRALSATQQVLRPSVRRQAGRAQTEATRAVREPQLATQLRKLVSNSHQHILALAGRLHASDTLRLTPSSISGVMPEKRVLWSVMGL
jgi:hypothetical protein